VLKAACGTKTAQENIQDWLQLDEEIVAIIFFFIYFD
jgi:hypothetical protein